MNSLTLLNAKTGDYLHHFGTGWQILTFPNREAAIRFAITNNLELQ